MQAGMRRLPGLIRTRKDQEMLLDVTISSLGIGAIALLCPLMMLFMMVGMLFMGGGHGHGMCDFWSHRADHHEREDREDESAN